MPLKSVKLAWLPIQNNPKIKKSLLANSSVSITCGDRSIINCRSKAAIKKMIKSGTLRPFLELFSLKKIPAKNTNGINHKVLPNFKVAAVFAASGSKAKAAPITELVSWTARETQAPNSTAESCNNSPMIGNTAIAMALRIKMMVKVIIKSFELALIMGAMAAIAVPPQIALPTVNKIA